MPTSINTALIGKEYGPYPFTVERGKIKEFARAIGDLNPCYLDDRVGAASEWGDLIAPPTFAVTFRDETADTGAMLRDLGTDVSRILHGEQPGNLPIELPTRFELSVNLRVAKALGITLSPSFMASAASTAADRLFCALTCAGLALRQSNGTKSLRVPSVPGGYFASLRGREPQFRSRPW